MTRAFLRCTVVLVLAMAAAIAPATATSPAWAARRGPTSSLPSDHGKSPPKLARRAADRASPNLTRATEA